jgi:DNA polymerase-3 subunit gamma/tau
MSQAFYRKWRPQKWDEVVGQEHVIQTLRNAITSERVAHAYLFAGPRGTGKTTTARLLAKAVNCLAANPAERPCNQCAHCVAVNEGRFLDLIEIDAASNTSVEDVRDLRDKINFAPSQGTYKVYIIDEVHMLSAAAFNALLKTLEEPPPHAIFILATTEVHKIPATVLSRCQRHEFRRLPVADIVAHLRQMAAQESIEVEPEAYTLIAHQATGSLRDAISLLDQLASVEDMITLKTAQAVLGTAVSQAVIDLVEAILSQQAAVGLNLIHRSLDAGADARQFARQMVEYLRNLLLARLGSVDQVDATQEVRRQMVQQAQAFTSAHLMETLRAFNNAANDERTGWQPGLALEMAFAAAIEPSFAPQAAAVPEPSRPAQTAAPRLAAVATPAPTSSASLTENKPATAAAPASPTPSAAAQTPPRPPTVPIETPAEAPASGLSLSRVMQSWPQIRTVVKKRKSQTEGLLNSCKPMGVKDNVLILGFGSEVLKSKMEMNDNLQITQAALQQVLGVSLQVRCILANGKPITSTQNVEVDSDGMVGTALRDLGGEIVDVI